MARVYRLDTSADAIATDLTRSLQSAHINLLLGSGASQPAVPLAGDVEREIEELYLKGHEDQATARLFALLASVQGPINKLIGGTIDASCADTLAAYTELLRTLESILLERRTTILPRQVTVFSTNYDTFIDAAAMACEATAFANGFQREVVPDQAAEYSSRRFFQTTYEMGNLYDYRVEIPSMNLVKLHGCLSWQSEGDKIVQRSARFDLPLPTADVALMKAFISRYALVLPQATKLNKTVLDRTYYELLRLFANALDKENVLLIVFGFSFRDEHILHIARRALKNPTLRVLLVAYDSASSDAYTAMFSAHRNVIIIAPAVGEQIDCQRFNKLIADSSPRLGSS